MCARPTITPRDRDDSRKSCEFDKTLIEKGFCLRIGWQRLFPRQGVSEIWASSRTFLPTRWFRAGSERERGNFPDDPKKRDPLDFVLWQAQAAPNPHGTRRGDRDAPSWHIECSAMNYKNVRSRDGYSWRRRGFGLSASRSAEIGA